jgi:hypothetical protein
VTPVPFDVALDLGSGNEVLTAMLAQRCNRLYVVEQSRQRFARVVRPGPQWKRKVQILGSNVRGFVPPGYLDIIVGNCALSGIGTRTRRRVLMACFTWMKAGGGLAICDLMLDRTALATPRRSSRIAWPRHTRRRWLIALEAWMMLLESAGFRDVRGTLVGDQSGVASGMRP